MNAEKTTLSIYKINETFTPRRAEVNLKTYVPRLELEKALVRSVCGTLHTLICGESGSGKSWLYKKVLNQNEIDFVVANCALAQRFSGVVGAICNAISPDGEFVNRSYEQTKKANASIAGFGGGLEKKDSYVYSGGDVFLSALKKQSERNSGKLSVIVLDNLETIFDNKDFMSELADLIILLDDEAYSKCNIKFVVVGTPTGVLEYFAKTKNLESVSNRIEEIQKVSGFNLPMVKTLTINGLNNILNLKISGPDIDAISNHVYRVTFGLAQRVQEYLLKLAFQVADNKFYSRELLDKTDLDWLKSALRKNYTTVESHLDDGFEKYSLNNHVIFCIGETRIHQFSASDISGLLQEKFPSITQTKEKIQAILGEMTEGESPILRKNPKTDHFRIVDSRYLMCIRTMMYMNRSNGFIEKKNFVV